MTTTKDSEWPFIYGRFLTKNQILHPNLFPSQSQKPRYDKEYVWNLIIDFINNGFIPDAFTEVEGGIWLPGSYLIALQETDSIEQWATGSQRKFSLWALTKVHAIRFRDPNGHIIEWDNINGVRITSRGLVTIPVSNQRNIVKYKTKHKPIDSITVELNMDEYEVDYSIESHGCGPTMPSWNYAGDPGEPPEVCLWRVKWLTHGIELDIHNPKLTGFYEELEQRVVQYVAEHAYEYDPEDYM